MRESRQGGTGNPVAGPVASRADASKIEASHLERLAVVYLRQSTAQQVTDHPESTSRQYGLVERAKQLGWRPDRVLVIDEDLGCSGRTLVGRAGFQRLLEELEGDRVGLVLGLEMSRLARSGRDWHHLFEVCAFRHSLLADEQGVYDPLDTNDQMLLGLKGIMSEVELQIMRGRLERGRLHKAERGELFHEVPRGYVRMPGGGVEKDPDEQIRSTISMIFEKFEELPSAGALTKYLLQHAVRLPTRLRNGAVEWRRPTWHGVYEMLRHPIYAGAYAYGHRGRQSAKKGHKRDPREMPSAPEDEWKILIRDRVPAYISWTQYVTNRRRMRENRPLWHTRGATREGTALLGGILFCGHCGRRMQVQYNDRHRIRYECHPAAWDIEKPRCGGLAGQVLDDLVAAQVLRAIEPASLELSMQVLQDAEQERERHVQHLQQGIERAEQEVRAMERNCMAVDPDNRLVRRTLEQRWEEALDREREAREAYERFLEQGPAGITDEQRERIEALSADLPALWHSARTSPRDRKQIVRCLVDRINVTIDQRTQHTDVEVRWDGGFVSQHPLVRTVQKYEQLAEFPELRARFIELRQAGYRSTEIAHVLNDDGFRTPKLGRRFTAAMASALGRRSDVVRELEPSVLPSECWRAGDLARDLGIPEKRIKTWAREHPAHIVQRPFGGVWILRLDGEARDRLWRDVGAAPEEPEGAGPSPEREE